ncbi:MAG: hypothetical protein JRM76_03365 [Nitrososphaerota archaeon]|nr:hypothetical protein [Nitrososphaerota archaeon]MDG6992262.1 hypothetical protein [Nitrososphaerota archaeon]MDG7032412.1 hypothetical protein [Nitrososphaerota archaeon]
MAEKVPGWIERLLLPRLSSIEGESKALKGELNGLRGEMRGEFKAVHSETRRLDEKIDSLRNETLTRFDGIEKRLDFARDLGVLQTKVTELEARLPKA